MYACAEQVQLERTNGWLRTELHTIWNTYFPDVPRANHVEIRFERRWKTRLGMITMAESGLISYIGINRLLSSPSVPDEVCRLTIAHELVHYAHGFGSPLPRRHRHPHQGNVVGQELTTRGLAEELDQWEAWTRADWYPFYYAQVPGLKAVKERRSMGRLEAAGTVPRSLASRAGQRVE